MNRMGRDACTTIGFVEGRLVFVGLDLGVEVLEPGDAGGDAVGDHGVVVVAVGDSDEGDVVVVVGEAR